MKSFILSLFMSVFLMSTAFTQSAENACIKGEVSGLTASGQLILTMTNKQTCVANIGYDIGAADIAYKNVASGSSDTFNITITGPLTLLLETNTNCSGGCDGTHLPLLVDIVNTPVTGLSSFKAKFYHDSLIIKSKWTTLTEINNDYFILSVNGKPVKEIKTHALDGNSAVPQNYEVNYNVANGIAIELGFGILIVFVLAVWIGWLVFGTRAKSLGLAFVLTLVFLGCKKDDVISYLTGEYIVTLKQVDRDGTYEYAPDRSVTVY
jgi:hypothetical protein